MNQTLATLSLTLTALLFAFTGCGPSAAAPDNGKPTVVATTTVIADLARTLGGDAVNVVGIMRPGEDPHIYDVKPNDAKLIADADLVLLNGMNLEATLRKIVDNNAEGDTLALAEVAKFEVIAGDSEAYGDPHLWMDPVIWAQCAELTRDALIKLVPDEAEAITARTDVFLKELKTLGQEVRDLFEPIPQEQRVIVTSHDAFAYFGRSFGIEVHGVIGISTDAQPRPQDIAALEKLVTDRGVRAVFIETSTSPTLNTIVEKVADSTGASVGGTLYSDSLGADGSPGDTYLKMMRHNANTVAEALAGKPE